MLSDHQADLPQAGWWWTMAYMKLKNDTSDRDMKSLKNCVQYIELFSVNIKQMKNIGTLIFVVFVIIPIKGRNCLNIKIIIVESRFDPVDQPIYSCFARRLTRSYQSHKHKNVLWTKLLRANLHYFVIIALIMLLYLYLKLTINILIGD